MKKNLTIWGIVFLVLISGCEKKIPVEITKFTPQSEFIFIGTLQLKNSATLLVENNKNLAVVLVDKILYAPTIFNHWEKKQITVKLNDLEKFQQGEKAVFFTKSWLFSDEIAVVEIGSFKPETLNDKELSTQILSVKSQEQDNHLKERLNKADYVILGTITGIQKSEAEPMVTEHDPQWMNAEIKVETVLKGNIKESTFTISYPGSKDVMWMDVPKLKEGMDGIWILYAESQQGFKSPHPAIFTQGDFLNREELNRCQKLIGK